MGVALDTIIFTHLETIPPRPDSHVEDDCVQRILDDLSDAITDETTSISRTTMTLPIITCLTTWPASRSCLLSAFLHLRVVVHRFSYPLIRLTRLCMHHRPIRRLLLKS
jgi:hypothetical protein